VAARQRNGLLPDMCEQQMEGFKHRPLFHRYKITEELGMRKPVLVTAVSWVESSILQTSWRIYWLDGPLWQQEIYYHKLNTLRRQLHARTHCVCVCVCGWVYTVISPLYENGYYSILTALTREVLTNKVCVEYIH
jgi:hypothetical protein